MGRTHLQHQRNRHLRRQENTRISKIRNAIFNRPDLISTLFKDTTIKHGFLYRELEKVISCRFGIEFEYIGCFGRDYAAANGLTNLRYDEIDKIIKEKYGFIDFKSDSWEWDKVIIPGINGADDQVVSSNDITCTPDLILSRDSSLSEFRVSFDNPRVLTKFFDFLIECKRYCKISEFSGIHIHVDLSDYMTSSSNNSRCKMIQRYISKHLDEIVSIFPVYKGSYNKRVVKIEGKGSYVNLSRLNTMEVRIAPLSFEYCEIITWLSKLSAFRRKLLHDCRLTNKSIKSEKGVGKYSTYISASDLANAGLITVNADTGLCSGGDVVTSRSNDLYDNRVSQVNSGTITLSSGSATSYSVYNNINNSTGYTSADYFSFC